MIGKVYRGDRESQRNEITPEEAVNKIWGSDIPSPVDTAVSKVLGVGKFEEVESRDSVTGKSSSDLNYSLKIGDRTIRMPLYESQGYSPNIEDVTVIDI